MPRLDFLHTKHPIYEANLDLWLQNERRMRGGIDILDELTPFDWEDPTKSHFKARQDQATYLNFPDRFASVMVGHMMRQAPQPGNNLSFGALGEVRRERNSAEPTRAELLYFNTNGVGSDGSQWNNWWTMVGKAAIGTGHRWILVEGPPEPPTTFRDEIMGLRPFVSHYSPISVPNWEYENGQLSMAIIKRMRRQLRVDATGAVQGNTPQLETLLLIRKTWTGFGDVYATGGWWLYDANDDLTDSGSWESTDGEIPMVPIYYERVESDAAPVEGLGRVSDIVAPRSQLRVTPAISRSGVTEMGNAAIAYMNISSAADFDAFDGAASVQALAGVDEAGFNLFVAKIKAGTRYAPLMSSEGDSKTPPRIIDASTGVVVADVFARRLDAKRQEAIELMLNEIEQAPYASGASKTISFTDAKAPRLAMFASEIETAQNTVIFWLEKMWAKAATPSGSVTWPRQFDLLDVLKAVLDYFNVESIAQITSPTIAAKAMLLAAQKLGLVNSDADEKVAQQEYLSSGKKKMAQLNAPKPVKTAPQPVPGASPPSPPAPAPKA